MWKIKYRFLSALSENPMSEKEYNYKNKKFNKIFTVILLFLTPVVLIYYAGKDYKIANALCSKGIQTAGIVTSIVANNSGESNITTWMVGYSFSLKGKKYFGKIENDDNPTQNRGDIIKVVYSADNPDINAGFLANIDIKCISYGEAIWKNLYLLLIGLVVIVLVNLK